MMNSLHLTMVCPVPYSLTHSVDDRPKFKDLVTHKFIKYIEKEKVDVASWYDNVIEKETAMLGDA